MLTNQPVMVTQYCERGSLCEVFKWVMLDCWITDAFYIRVPVKHTLCDVF